jgi:hypothetical protein
VTEVTPGDRGSPAQEEDRMKIKNNSDIRLAIARVYGRPDICTSQYWSVLPQMTSSSTLGLLDIAKGMAWDTGIEIVEDHDLDVLSTAVPSANLPAGGVPVRFDGEVVEIHGHAAGRPPSAPDGWRQISLPTWEGYEGDGTAKVPDDLYRPETWVRPTLVAGGLWTCYDRAGTCTEAVLMDSGAHAHRWPWGLPPWVSGQSVTVIDAMIDAAGSVVPMTWAERQSDEAELAGLRAILLAVRDWAIDLVESGARNAKLSEEDRAELAECAEDFDAGDRRLGELARRIGNAQGWSQVPWDRAVTALRRAEDAIQAELPHRAAVALGQSGALGHVESVRDIANPAAAEERRRVLEEYRVRSERWA